MINVGPEKIDGIDEMLSAVQERGIIIVVLTNAASHPSSLIASKYKGWNLPIDGANVVSSRGLTQHSRRQLVNSSPYILRQSEMMGG